MQFHKRPVEPVRNGVEVIGEEARVDVEGHGGGGVPEHQLHRFDVGACGYGKAGCGVAQLVRRESKQSDLLRSRTEEPRPEVVLRSTPPSGAVNTRSPGAFPVRWSANSSARKRGIGTERR
jgi:hypothetical protein